MQKKIEVGYQAFIVGSDEEFGAVRDVSPDGTRLTVYVENAGDFVVPSRAVREVHDQKVVLDPKELDHKLQRAIGHAHDAEDPEL
jgi:hypothetical protein